MTSEASVTRQVGGQISYNGKGIPSLLVELFDVPKGFHKELPISDRHRFADFHLHRLGSTMTGPKGAFAIRYTELGERYRWSRERQEFNLWLIVTRCTGNKTQTLFQDAEVRYSAGVNESYHVCLSDDAGKSLERKEQKAPSPAERVEQSRENLTEIARATTKAGKQRFSEKLEVRRAFKKDVLPQIQKAMSGLERDKKHKVRDAEYLEQDADIRKEAESRIRKDVEKRFSHGAQAEKLVLNGRISLTAEQLKTLKDKQEEDNQDDTVIVVSEETLDEVLKESSGKNPEDGTAIVNRVDVVQQFCRRTRSASACLQELEESERTAGDTDDENDDGAGLRSDATDNPSDAREVPLSERNETDNEDVTNGNIDRDTLHKSIPSYIAKVLNETSTLDPGSTVISGPGSRQTEKSISENDSFPSITLPPGPADVPAYHDFHNLQIAFKPVWQEALDDGLIADAEAAYERYVEAGGDGLVFWTLLIEGSWLPEILETPDPVVMRHIEITREEWSALNDEQQATLREVANGIDAMEDALEATVKIFDDVQQNPDDYTTSEDILSIVNATQNAEARLPVIKQFVSQRQESLREQGDRLVRLARREMETNVSRKSVVPYSNVLQQLHARISSFYPAKYFAASKAQRSINFGLLITYRQQWTPVSYQVGELIKSVPLAPKEVRKYNKKIVKKTRRSTKEVESNLESMKSETTSTTRAESDIVSKAMEKTNFNASANGSFSVGVWSGGGTSALTQDAEDQSSEAKKSFHEAVVKAAREYKNEMKVELETEESLESEFTESGELINPNEELTVTYLFYELQRRYKVHERLHRLTSIVLVAQEMPKPHEIDNDWLITHRWILNRVMLDDAFKQPLLYVAEGLVAEDFALREARSGLQQQKRLVEELKDDIVDSRADTEARYAALQRSMERTARASQRKKKGGGLFGFVKKLAQPSFIGGVVDSFLPGGGNGSETVEAARLREAASQDAYQRELQKLRDLENQIGQMNAGLTRATEEYTDRLSAHLSNVVQVAELKVHIKDNITHYMQAIWLHEPFQQRWLRLKDVAVPVINYGNAPFSKYAIKSEALTGSLANVTHVATSVHGMSRDPNIKVPDEDEDGLVDTVPLYQVADIDDLLGFRANYMIFPMRKGNALTDYMMTPFVEKSAEGMGITDPDDYGNMTLDEFTEYVCCLKKELKKEDFDKLRGELRAQLKTLLQSPLRNDEEVVVPMDAMYIEALPGATPILEDFKLLHRQIDVADAQEEVRMKKMEKIRYAQRLLDGRTDDPASDTRYEFTGNPDMDFAIAQPGNGSGAEDGQ